MPLGLHTPVKTKKSTAPKKVSHRSAFVPYTPLDFIVIERRAREFVDLIESRRERIISVLLEYESYEVACDEMERTLDILRSLQENKEYFKLRVGPVASFLPRNQPLYALTCFVIVPSFMASQVYFRIPHSMRQFFPKLIELLDFQQLFPNITISHLTRLEFLRERSALRVDPVTNEGVPVTDAVIFTGLPAHAEQLRRVFDDRTLFISNGAGHNPIVISHDADIDAALDAALTLQLYNQGQDCAAPNAVLIHRQIFPSFFNMLHAALREVRAGQYHDRTCRVGPISDPHDLIRIQEFLIHHREWTDPLRPGTIHTRHAIVEPTIICKPLKERGNFSEIFAPIIFLQVYEDDAELAKYFEDPQYAPHAMYVSLYGTSTYVTHLAGKEFDGKVLHDAPSILHNTHLHIKGIERGTQPYGGNGIGASSLSVHGKIITKPTLPQRDIFEWVAKPLLQRKALATAQKKLLTCTRIHTKNVEKIMRVSTYASHEGENILQSSISYVDTHAVRPRKSRRFAEIDDEHSYRLLEKPNLEYIASLQPADIKHFQELRKLLRRRSTLSTDAFSTQLYAIPTSAAVSKRDRRERQLRFFQQIYQLLLGRDSGPRLTIFLADVDLVHIRTLLDP